LDFSFVSVCCAVLFLFLRLSSPLLFAFVTMGRAWLRIQRSVRFM
jgi:hypothetical protein